MGRRLEGGDRLPDPSIGQTAKVVAVGGGEKSRDEMRIQQYGCTHQIRLEFGGSRAKHQGEAIRLAESEPPDSSPFKHPHFWSGGRWGGAGRRPRNVSGEGDALGSGIV